MWNKFIIVTQETVMILVLNMKLFRKRLIDSVPPYYVPHWTQNNFHYSIKILFNLSSSTNITESLNKFGVGESDTEILIVGVDNSLEDVKENLSGWDEKLIFRNGKDDQNCILWLLYSSNLFWRTLNQLLPSSFYVLENTVGGRGAYERQEILIQIRADFDTSTQKQGNFFNLF